MRTKPAPPRAQQYLLKRRYRAALSLDELQLRSGIERSRLSRAERGYLALTSSELAKLRTVLPAEHANDVGPPPAGQRHRFPAKFCEGTCGERFIPTGANTKRCPACRKQFNRQASRDYHREHYVPKGRDQKGPKNNAWKGGSSPPYYQRIAFETYGKQCSIDPDHRGVLVVHHRDHNRKNNDAANLQVLCKRCHQLEHACAERLPRGSTRPPASLVKCPACMKHFKAKTGRQQYCNAGCRIGFNVKKRQATKARRGAQ